MSHDDQYMDKSTSQRSPSQGQNSSMIDNPDFVDIGGYENVVIDLRYASTNNFMGENVYGDFNIPYLHQEAALKFKKAIENLKMERPGWKFLIFDALRPRRMQRKLWSYVKDTPQEKYVANPDKGSVHNYGFALDLTLISELGQEVDMGTPFDSFEDKAQPQLEQQFLKEKLLTEAQFENRQLLRKVMVQAGFTQLPHEWWHYNGLSIEELKQNYKIVE